MHTSCWFDTFFCMFYRRTYLAVTSVGISKRGHRVREYPFSEYEYLRPGSTRTQCRGVRLVPMDVETVIISMTVRRREIGQLCDPEVQRFPYVLQMRVQNVDLQMRSSESGERRTSGVPCDHVSKHLWNSVNSAFFFWVWNTVLDYLLTESLTLRRSKRTAATLRILKA